MSWGQEVAWQAQLLPGMDCPAGRGLFIRRGLFIYRALAGRCQAWLGTPGCQGGCRRGRCKGGRVYHPPRGGPCVPPQGGRATGGGRCQYDNSPPGLRLLRVHALGRPRALGGLPVTEGEVGMPGGWGAEVHGPRWALRGEDSLLPGPPGQTRVPQGASHTGRVIASVSTPETECEHTLSPDVVDLKSQSNWAS